MSGLVRVSRSAFLRTCGTLVLGRGLAPLSIFGMERTAVGSAGACADDVSASRFHPHLGTTAYATATDGIRVPLRLAAVSAVRRSGPFEQYSVFFSAAADTLTEGTYPMSHAALGSFELFIVPVGHPSGQRTVYEACFSRRARTGDGGHRG